MIFSTLQVLSLLYTRGNIEKMIFSGKGSRPRRAYTVSAFADQIVRIEEIAMRQQKPVAQIVRSLLDFALDAIEESTPHTPKDDSVEGIIV